MKNRIVLFGATGYTGRLTAQALVNYGEKPLLVARNKESLQKLSEKLGGLPKAVANIQTLENILEEGDILISTVGPFVRFGNKVVETAIRKKAIYLDSTGEQVFIKKIFQKYHSQALIAKVPLLTAFGYDYVPGNCVGASALKKAGEKATHLDIGYFFTSTEKINKSVSEGTMASMAEAGLEPGMVWTKGRLKSEYGGKYLKEFFWEQTIKPTISFSGSEHFSLPKIYPNLQNLRTYLGWFGKKSYLMHRFYYANLLFLKTPGMTTLLKWFARKKFNSKGTGPSEKSRKNSGSYIVGIASDSQGKELAKGELVGVNGYTFTANILAWGAIQAKEGKIQGVGALGPVEAFGLELLVEGCEKSGLKLSIS